MGGPGEDWHDAAHWDARYLASEREVVVDPDPSVVALVSGMPGAPGRALDLGCGEGRHAIWLAGRGWQVTAVDFSAVALGRARSAEPEASVNWTVADVPTWLEAEAASESRPTAYDLVVLAYLRLESYDLARARRLIAPGGHLLAVSHGEGGKGPRQGRFRTTVESMRERAGDLEVLSCEELWHEGSDGRRRSRIALLARRPVASE